MDVVTDEPNELAEDDRGSRRSRWRSQPTANAAADAVAARGYAEDTDVRDVAASKSRSPTKPRPTKRRKKSSRTRRRRRGRGEPHAETNKGPVYLAPPEDDDDQDGLVHPQGAEQSRAIRFADALQRQRADRRAWTSYFDEIIVPTEKVTEFKGGKKKVVKRKLYPGYIVVHMDINDDTWFLVRETPGIGDFTGSGGKPTPMLRAAKWPGSCRPKQEEDRPKRRS